MPSTHQRKFTVDGADCVTPNLLPQHATKHQNFAIIGGGKTAMDVAVWLLDNGADPSNISWVVPRSSWLINRATTQPSEKFFKYSIGSTADQFEIAAKASDVDEMFLEFERTGSMLRIDTSQLPKMFHYATISEGEIQQLKRIDHVIGGSHVSQIDASQMTMSDGTEIAMKPGTLYIDCTATAVAFSDGVKPVFQDGLITLQSLR